MQRIILDTDVASLTLKGQLPSALAAQLAGAQLGLTFVTLAELTKWATLRSWGTPKRHRLEQWLAAKPVLPYAADIARTWGQLAAYAVRRGRPRPHNDMWIAACCLAYGLPLATLNIKDFADFAEHEGLILIAAGN
ncbi:type II toxin-antitoxin system VapC family toxin [Crossiella sp. SN42]|uniref:type II toxin-antitoxin system VapC family toxin n=1 Tax=Crossiella sp. SN42 TaxID=2944808 RepID=UPI00207D527A|nr:type II toxin-antitoxin system VapC family toxin [Crossiella sp. SN42]MCO1581236.1 type II toxin-antitoxin system VapC family toxin [Crossiella sp. SN42]